MKITSSEHNWAQKHLGCESLKKCEEKERR